MHLHSRTASSSRLLLAFTAAVITFTSGPPAAAQARSAAAVPRPPAAIGAEEASEIAAGWTLLAQGRIAQASASAGRVLTAYPRSGAGLMLAVEADIAASGALTGLDRYERWLGGRPLEEPSVLYRVARAALFEELAQKQDPTARAEAWLALADAGEAVPAELDVPPPQQGASSRALAALGHEKAVRVLLAELRDSPGNPTRTIEALGASGSPLAADPLVPLLKDARQEVRGAAADALGKIGGPNAAARVKPLLTDRSLFVRARAAGALMRVGDFSGQAILEAMAAEETPSIRLLAAEGLASQQDFSWMSLVRDLARSSDAEVRAASARLIAKHDPELAKSVLDALLVDTNPALQELAAQNYGEIAADCDVITLRRLLRQVSRVTKVRAAARLLGQLR